MTADLVFFILLAVVSIASAIGMLLSRSPIYSALYLVANFLTIAVLYILLHAPFLAMSQITIYAGAIMVLFLFVIMLLGDEPLKGNDTLKWQQPFAVVLGVLLLGIFVYLFSMDGAGIKELFQVTEGYGSPREIGLVLFNQYLLPFEITSVLLLVGIIGAVVLTKGINGENEAAGEESS
jgi:NADH-quinone oxidoreductase subunit J